MDGAVEIADALSAAGAARRERMMGEVSRAAGARRARRTTVKAAGALVLLCAAGGAVWIAATGGNVGGGTREVADALPGRGAPVREMEVPAPEGRVVRVRVVTNEPGIVARYAAAPVERVASMDDAELMRLMKEMGKPTGIVRTGGKVMLTAEMEKKEGEPVSARPARGAARG